VQPEPHRVRGVEGRRARAHESARRRPFGHIGDPADVGDVVVWLAGPASRFVTGQVITVDGGRTARPSLPDILR